MPQQLIYTSAPRGIVAGRSGYCTVARSAGMREALALRLEQLSYYQHFFLGGAGEHPIFAHRIIDIRGARFHVLSRLQDAGLDFTGRTNFIAHHLAVTPEERSRLPSPPVVLRDWSGWARQWTGEPHLLQSEDWAALIALGDGTSLPAKTWRQMTGDAVNAYGLLELKTGTFLRVGGQPEAVVLGLMAESLELLEVRDVRHDWRTAAWQFTFTTSLQEQDNPADFRWRCVQGEPPSRPAGADIRPLSEITATSCTEEEAALARTGRQSPRFVVEPQNVQISEGETARIQAKADGVPNPSYQWFKVDRENHCQLLEGATQPELVLATPPRGLSRYALRIQNSAGEQTSRTIVLSVEFKSSQVDLSAGPAQQFGEPTERHQKTAEDIEQQRHRLEAEARESRRNRRMYGKPLLLLALLFAVLAAGAIALLTHRTPARVPAQSSTNMIPSAATASNLEIPPPAKFPSRLAVESPATNRAHLLLSENSIPKAAVKTNAAVKRQSPLASAEGFKLPPGYLEMPIGATSKANFEFLPDEHPQIFILSGAGDGFDDNGDNLIFACQTNSQSNSPRDFTTRLLSIEPSTPGSRCGIMVRESAATNSAFLFIGASSETLLVCNRDADGVYHCQVSSTNKPAEPLWLKISETNGVFAPSWSSEEKPDSSSWLGSEVSVQLRTNSIIGFALASGNLENLVKARFAMVAQKQSGRPAGD